MSLRSVLTPPKFFIFCLLTLAGFYGHYFHYPLFFNVSFLFGGIFTMLVLQLYGWRAGTLSALAAGSYTLILWGHPYALIVFGLEALVTGLVYERRGGDLVLADTFFWLVLGMPLVMLYFRAGLDFNEDAAQVMMLKYAYNGIAVTIVARVLFTVLAVSQKDRGAVFVMLPGLRENIFNILSSLVLVFSLAVLIVTSRTGLSSIEERIVSRLDIVSTQISEMMRGWVNERLTFASSLAAAAANGTDLQEQVDLARAVDSDLLRVGIFNVNAVTVAFSPSVDYKGNSTIGRDFSDRTYLPKVRESRHPLLTEVMMGRVGKPFPIILTVAPVIRNGAYDGYAAGIISVSSLSELLLHMARPWGLTFTLTDENGTVISTNRTGLSPMQHLPLPLGRTVIPVSSVVSKSVPQGRRVLPFTQAWRDTVYFSERVLDSRTSWKLLLEAPVAPWEPELLKLYYRWMEIASLLFIASALTAAWVSRQMLQSLNRLTEISRGLPQKIERSEQVEWPISHLPEIGRLIDHFRTMAAALYEKLVQLSQTVSRLQSEKEERRKIEERMKGLRERIESAERARISRDIHDGIGQSLMAIKLNMQMLQADHGGEECREIVDEITAVSEELREIVRALRPSCLEEADLDSAVRSLCAKVDASSGVNVVPAVSGDFSRVAPDLKLALFRICQEALTNAVKHAQAQSILVCLECSCTMLRLSVADDGVGGVAPFDHPSQGGAGLSIMRERVELIGGSLSINSPAWRGTTIIVEVPLNDQDSHC